MVLYCFFLKHKHVKLPCEQDCPIVEQVAGWHVHHILCYLFESILNSYLTCLILCFYISKCVKPISEYESPIWGASRFGVCPSHPDMLYLFMIVYYEYAQQW